MSHSGLNQLPFLTITRPFTSNFSNRSVSALAFTLSCHKSSAPNQRRKILVTRSSIAVEQQQTQTKTAVIRIGTRGRYCLLCSTLPSGLALVCVSYWIKIAFFLKKNARIIIFFIAATMELSLLFLFNRGSSVD